jgi:hypothetical protein
MISDDLLVKYNSLGYQGSGDYIELVDWIKVNKDVLITYEIQIDSEDMGVNVLEGVAYIDIDKDGNYEGVTTGDSCTTIKDALDDILNYMYIQLTT